MVTIGLLVEQGYGWEEAVGHSLGCRLVCGCPAGLGLADILFSFLLFILFF